MLRACADVQARYIDFISAYCDRWCERCAFTSRCSAFAAEAAIAMCGDVEEGLELAVGRPAPAEPAAQPSAPPPWLTGIDNATLVATEEEEFRRKQREQRARVEGTPIMQIAWAYGMVAYTWLKERHQPLAVHADDVLKEALAVVLHDSVFITVKLSRAVNGYDEHLHEPSDEDDPVQNDWNGTAKVALISIERSEAAWRVISAATGDETPTLLADRLRDLRNEVEAMFPRARWFVRPGFDDSAR